MNDTSAAASSADSAPHFANETIVTPAAGSGAAPPRSDRGSARVEIQGSGPMCTGDAQAGRSGAE